MRGPILLRLVSAPDMGTPACRRDPACHPWTPPAPQGVSSRPAFGSRLPPSIRSRRPPAAGLDEFRGPAPDHKRGLFRPWQATGSADPGPTAHAILDYRPRSPWKPFGGGPTRPGARASGDRASPNPVHVPPRLTPPPRGSPRRG